VDRRRDDGRDRSVTTETGPPTRRREGGRPTRTRLQRPASRRCRTGPESRRSARPTESERSGERFRPIAEPRPDGRALRTEGRRFNSVGSYENLRFSCENAAGSRIRDRGLRPEATRCVASIDASPTWRERRDHGWRTPRVAARNATHASSGPRPQAIRTRTRASMRLESTQRAFAGVERASGNCARRSIRRTSAPSGSPWCGKVAAPRRATAASPGRFS
jgi:hypothetical protein